jgi:small-conductance mechanosensitive channel
MMPRIINIEGREDLVRDTETKAVIATDKDQLRAYKTKVEQSNRLRKIEEEQSVVRGELQEIKNLLQTLIQKGIN